MAVLPTPGSPIRTGLFLVRRDEDLDDAADLVVAADDRVELAGPGLGGQVAAVLLERRVGALGVLRGDALAAADALERLEDGLAAGRVPLEQGLALAADLGDRRAAGARSRRTRRRAAWPRPRRARSTRRARGSIDSEPPWIRARRARIAASSPRNPGRSTPSRRRVSAGMPSSGSTSADRMCSASRIGLSRRWAVAWAATMASWAFWVKRSSCMVVSSLGFGRLAQRGSGWLTRSRKVRAAAFASSDRLVGRTTRALTYRSPWPVALKRGMPWPDSRNVRPGWVPAGIVSRTRPLSVSTVTSAPSRASSSVKGARARDRRRAEERLLERQRELALEVGASPGEPAVRQDADDDDDVAAARAALPESLIRVPVSAPGRDGDLEALAVDVDEPGRAVVRLVEGDLGLGLVDGRWVGRAAVGRPDRPSGRRCPSRSGCRRSRGRRSGASRAAGRAGRPAGGAPPRRRTSGRSRRTRRGRRWCGTRSGRCRPGRRSRRSPPKGDRRCPGRTGLARARLMASQLAPSSSYCLRLAGSLRTSLASLTSLNLRSAAVSPGLASGWCWRASLRNAFLISAWDAVFGTPRTA